MSSWEWLSPLVNNPSEVEKTCQVRHFSLFLNSAVCDFCLDTPSPKEKHSRIHNFYHFLRSISSIFHKCSRIRLQKTIKPIFSQKTEFSQSPAASVPQRLRTHELEEKLLKASRGDQGMKIYAVKSAGSRDISPRKMGFHEIYWDLMGF